MRLFIGIPLPHDVAVSLSSLMLQRANLKLFPKASVPPAENLHITLKFIGEVDETHVPSIINSLSSAIHHRRIGSTEEALPSALDISIDKAGIFSRSGIVYANVALTPALSSLAALIEETLHVRCSFPKENRAYHPHITLARIRRTRRNHRETQNKTSEHLGNDSPQIHGFETKNFVATGFALYRSHRVAHQGDNHPGPKTEHGERNSNFYEVVHSWDLGSTWADPELIL